MQITSQTAHDMKNSLGVILMRAELLLMLAEKPSVDRDAVISSAQAITDQVKAVRELLDGGG